MDIYSTECPKNTASSGKSKLQLSIYLKYLSSSILKALILSYIQRWSYLFAGGVTCPWAEHHQRGGRWRGMDGAAVASSLWPFCLPLCLDHSKMEWFWTLGVWWGRRRGKGASAEGGNYWVCIGVVFRHCLYNIRPRKIIAGEQGGGSVMLSGTVVGTHFAAFFSSPCPHRVFWWPFLRGEGRKQSVFVPECISEWY